MDQSPTPPPHSAFSPAAAAYGFVGASSSSASSSPHSSTSSSSAVSLSSSAHSQRRLSHSLYPPPLPRLASRGSGSASVSGSSRLQQIHTRPLSPPSSFLSELSSIRRTGAQLFSKLETLRAAPRVAPLPRLLHGRHQQQAQAQARASSATYSSLPPLPSGSSSGFAQPASQQQQEARPLSTAYSGLPPLPSGSFSGFAQSALQEQQKDVWASSTTNSGLSPLPSRSFSRFAHPASQQQLEARPSSTTCSGLPPLPGGSLSGFAQSASQQKQQQEARPSLTTYSCQPPQPSGSFSRFAQSVSQQQQAPRHSETTLFVSSSSRSADLQPRWRPSGIDNFSGTWFAQPSSDSEQYELPHMPLLPVQQEPVEAARLEPEDISLDGNDELGALLHSFESSPDQEALPLLESSSYRDSLQLGGSGQNAWDAAVAGSSEQSWIASRNYDMMNTSGSSSRGCRNMPWHCPGSSMENTICMPKLRLGGMESPRFPPLLQSTGSCASSSQSRRASHGDFFTDAEIETIMNEERLKEFVNTDPRRVKRILNNRVSAERVKTRKANNIRDLERQVDAMQINNRSLSSQVGSEQDILVELKLQNNEMRIRLQGLEEQAKLKEATSEALREEIQSLQLVELNALYANSLQNLMSSQMTDVIIWSANDLHQLSSQVNGASGYHQLQEEQHLQQTDDEFMGQQQ